MSSYFQEGVSVLDVGCGPGNITANIASLVGTGRVVGIDASQEIIDAASVEHRSENLSFAVGDAYHLDFHDNTFDVVHAHQVLQHLGDPVAALREWQRVAKPGGIICARDSDYSAMTWAPLDPHLNKWLALYDAGARANGGEPNAGRFLLAWANEAGLNNVRSTASTWCFANDSDRNWWGGLWAERILKSALADQLLTTGLATPDELESISDSFRKLAVDGNGWFAFICGEIVATKLPL